MASRCENEGWLVPPTMDIVDVAWCAGAPVAGCSNLHCSSCGRRVIHFDKALLAKRPEQWKAAYDDGRFPSLLSTGAIEEQFRTYLCGCRAFPAGREREVDELGIEDELPWYCGGHDR